MKSLAWKLKDLRPIVYQIWIGCGRPIFWATSLYFSEIEYFLKMNKWYYCHFLIYQLVWDLQKMAFARVSRYIKIFMAKPNKNKNQTPLLRMNFLWVETFSLGPKRFLHSKGPRNVICLWLRLGNVKQSRICNVYFRSILLVSAEDKSHY